MPAAQVNQEKATLGNVKKQLTKAGLSAQPLMNLLGRIDRDKELARQIALATNGFVSVKHRTVEEVADSGGESIMFGLYVEGTQNNRGTIARILQADSRSDSWFQEAVRREESNPTGMEFRVRVGGLSNRGRTAYVFPIARSLEQAKNEWKREKKARADGPKTVDECGSVDLLCLLAYKRYAENNDLTIIRFDPATNQALMVEKKDTTFLYLVGGAANIWDFTGGITKGTTTLDAEIARAVKLRNISSY